MERLVAYDSVAGDLSASHGNLCARGRNIPWAGSQAGWRFYGERRSLAGQSNSRLSLSKKPGRSFGGSPERFRRRLPPGSDQCLRRTAALAHIVRKIDPEFVTVLLRIRRS